MLLDKKNVENTGPCPNCGISWDGGAIPEESIKKGYYGTNSHFSNLFGLQLSWDSPDHYDGVSIWCCPNCGQDWCRWCGERLKPGETHPPFHDGTVKDQESLNGTRDYRKWNRNVSLA